MRFVARHLLEGIYTRRCIRKFHEKPVMRELLLEIIKAGTWVPSGLNNQPWRFVIIQKADGEKELGGQTKYGFLIDRAPVCIVVFIDRTVIYNDVKDHQAMGACIQNMLLAAHGLGLGAVWLGEILKNADAVRALLGLPKEMELMAVVTVGHPLPQKHSSNRKAVSEVLLKEY
jgi:nitroreductase